MNSKIVLSNFIWRFAERCGAQLVTLVVSMLLGRILGPTVYGTIALVTVFVMVLNVFVDSGMANALVQKKNADDLDFSSVFYFNVCACIVVYFVIWFLAPFLADFYNDPELVSIVRILGLTIIISGLKNVQQAYVTKTMQFRLFFFATSIGTVSAAVVGIIMALLGYGIWSLVAQYLVNTTLDTMVLWCMVKWRPKRMFSFQRLKGLLQYGWKLLVSSLLDTVYNELRQLIIAKLYTSEDLAFMNRGKQFPSFLVTNINSSIDSVLLPAMASDQDNRSRLKQMTRRAIKTSTYIMAPMMIGLIFIAEPLVDLLLGDAWLPCIPFLRIFCICFIFYPIHTSNLNAIKAVGRSDLFLKMEIVKKVVGIAILLISMWHGVMAMAYSLLVETFFGVIINTWPNRRLLEYNTLQQMFDIFPGILLATIMGFLIYPFTWTEWPPLFIMCLQIIAGGIIYVIGSAIFRLESFRYLWEMLQPIIYKVTKKIRNKER